MSEEKNAGWGKGAPPQSESVPTAAASAPLEQSPEAQAAASSHGSDTAQDISSSMEAGRDDEQGQEGEHSSPASSDPHPESTHQRVRDQDVLPEILGRQLRAAYGELLSTPLPDSITNLVKTLERREPTSSATTNAKQRSGKESR